MGALVVLMIARMGALHNLGRIAICGEERSFSSG
jgi:hypothetical protein